MAWEKVIPHPDTGTPVSYWEEMSVFYMKKTGTSLLVVGGWFSKELHYDGMPPLMTMEFTVPSGSNPQLAAAASAFISQYARAQDAFAGSTDA